VIFRSDVASAFTADPGRIGVLEATIKTLYEVVQRSRTEPEFIVACFRT